ncbi:MAG: tRNA threonylcarbamoyladenosine dehydratase [Treponema sp.]|jgi:tRNA A37 threonylcarbamoyladenosine dehydratase|nr:tRNA threonylcarbamoyladenosine dehydratase [Treponema sp.]
MNEFSRLQMTIGKEGLEKLGKSRVAVFGVGGVGGYVAEALVRSAIGAIDLIDNDTVSLSNLNRQIIALHSTVGKYKVDVAKERFLDINPECKINAIRCFFTSETSSQFDFLSYDYVVDCIDTVSGKIQIVMQAKQAGVPVICSMGAGNKMNPALFEVADIYQTSVCPLARVMRRELKERGVEKLKVVYSKEKPIQPQYTEDELQQMMVAGAKRAPGSNAFVPATAGLLIASEVVKDLLLKA